MKKTTSWGKVANWYDKLLEKDDDSFQKKVILPNLLRLMNLDKNRTVLDLACGQGYFTRIFSEVSAHVFASDISSELIKIAKQRNQKSNIEYYVSSADDIRFCADKSVDAILR